MCATPVLSAPVWIFYNVDLVRKPACGISIVDGSLIVWYRIPPAYGLMISDPWRDSITARSNALEFRRTVHHVHVRPSCFDISHRIPAWLVFAFGVFLKTYSVISTRQQRHANGECVRCGYDLRGAPGARCSECGYAQIRNMRFYKMLSISKRRNAAIIYLGSAVLWASVGTIDGGAFMLHWPDWTGCSRFLAQLCGPVVWLVVPTWPLIQLHLGDVLPLAFLAAMVWSIWMLVLFRTRLWRAPFSVHVVIITAWFLVSHFVIGIVLWFCVRI